MSSPDPALAFTQRLLRAYIDNSSLGFIGADGQQRVREWSARAAEIFGWSADDVLGKTRHEIGMVYEPDEDAVSARIATLDGIARTVIRGQNRNRTKDGRVIHCRWFNTRTVVDGEDQFISLVEDVTDEVMARADADTNEQRFRSVFANAADGMILLAADGTITHVNEAAQRMYCAPASTMVARSLTVLFAESSAWVARSSFSRVLLGETVTESTQARRADGTTLPVTFSLAPVRVGDRIVGVVATARDMSAFVEATASLEASEERFRSLFDYSPDAMLALALDGTLTRVNAAAAATYGREPAELLGRNVLALVAPSDARRGREAFAAAAAGKASAVELAAMRADGTTMPMLATLIPIVFRNTIAGVHLLARDLTPIRRAERDLAAQHERVRELYLVGASANANAENQIAATIDAGCRLLGMTSGALYDAEADRNVATVGEAIPRRLARLALGNDGALALDALDGVPHFGEAGVGEHRFGSYIGTAIDITGTRYGSLCFAAERARDDSFTDSDRDLVQLMGALIGSAIERGRSRARLKHLAYNDQLTALPNRAWFAERLRDELAFAAECRTRVAVMFLDLDRFKDINDTLGHALGDRLLQTIGDRLSSVVGGHGLVARMGGDEFIVLIPNDPTERRLNEMAQRIIEAIDQPLVVDGYEQFVTTSIGIAVYPADGEDADTLIKHADVAMYRAKERGRNTHQFFTPSLAASLRTRISQEKSLRKALERNEFVVHYQPQFALSNGQLVGVEALVRWQHPRLGLVSPDQFIPSAEMSGLIV
ncbi:MAG TPA: PAS domain S-box protein, partial [Candidatus Acidoferrum sp.]|nr:PAS domain S-box protein [Candidatus Acidoferrum sp.]